jgi:hypothetical protein
MQDMERRQGGCERLLAAQRFLRKDDTRWRREQRARIRRRMTLRGRVTLATLTATAFVALGWLVEPWSPQPARSAPSAPLAAVSAPPVQRALAEPGRVPAQVLERLPVTRAALALPETTAGDGGSPGLIYERVELLAEASDLVGPLRVEYTLDAELMREVFDVLEKGRVARGNVIVMDPETGRVLAYAATDPESFPPTRPYPAASLVKVITAAAALDVAPRTARLPCRFQGSPYRLTPARLDPPRSGNTVTLRKALATSNNQCFAQLAVHALGPKPMIEAIGRFGWLSPPAPAHAAGVIDLGEERERYELGKVGCGLTRGSRITPLHAAQLASSLVHGELVSPRWIERVVDGMGRELPVPVAALPRRVLSPEITEELREMLVETTRSGTARRAFRGRGGRPLLGDVTVAGKTGSLSGQDPDGRYEWFIGVAPADAPRIAVATVVVQDALWWRNASQISAEVLRSVFCSREGCKADNASRFLPHAVRTEAFAQRSTPAARQPGDDRKS